MRAKDYINGVKSGKISAIKTVKSILDEIKKINKDYNYFNNITDELALELAEKIEKNPKGRLAGLPVSIKDDICVKGVETTCSSNILRGYKPIFNATVVKKLVDEGAVIIGKTNQDAFGFGSFNINTDYKVPRNPLGKTRVTGGSSGGAAGFTALTEFPHVAIGESTGGSIAAPCSFCGVQGLTPTYGAVSRYGLIDYANSLDKIGAIGKCLDDVELVFDVIRGHDNKDSTSLNEELSNNNEVKTIGLIKETLDIDPKIKDLILKKLNELGIEYEKVSLPLTSKYSLASYYIIAMAEASTNLSKYCGMRYGQEEKLDLPYNEYFSDVRTKYFNKEAKRRIILGTFTRMAGYRDAFYLKAMKVRTLIINEYKKAFRRYDLLVSPSMPIIAPKFSEVDKLTPAENYMMDIMTVGPNLAGLPHLSLNAGVYNKMPVGIMFTGDHLNEKKLFSVGKKYGV
ncbi:Asp-tRNA(Asn)/Glu-tRNA(Gln) amidotransferase subunit GatA [Candidatus Woesearchaeota archaeon]|nr:Asp-tRNA(Asn)/Glu-tRNA(Gln) amidotransferase subunit GatA [Candidatus Woesearchaeota archaeon]